MGQRVKKTKKRVKKSRTTEMVTNEQKNVTIEATAKQQQIEVKDIRRSLFSALIVVIVLLLIFMLTR